MRLAGYRIHDLGLGSPGDAYTYAMASNGLFLEADNGLIRARVLLATADVRGLAPLAPVLELNHGLIPPCLLAQAIAVMPAGVEGYAAIAWDGSTYRLVVPPQEAGEAHVTYEIVPGTVVGIHGHGKMDAFFSYQDDQDDQGFQVSIVVGRLDRLLQEARARLSVYGYFAPVRLSQLFPGEFVGLEERDIY